MSPFLCPSLQATLGQIHAAESVVEAARKRASSASERLDIARLALRERQAEQRGASGLDEDGEPPVGLPVEIKVRFAPGKTWGHHEVH